MSTRCMPLSDLARELGRAPVVGEHLRAGDTLIRVVQVVTDGPGEPTCLLREVGSTAEPEPTPDPQLLLPLEDL